MQLTTDRTRKIRENLDARRRDLLLRYHRMLDRAEEEQADHSPELVDTANDQWDVRLIDRVSNVDVRTLGKIVAALRRLERGTYGICVDCDRMIPSARLAVLPEADRCAGCAKDAER